MSRIGTRQDWPALEITRPSHHRPNPPCKHISCGAGLWTALRSYRGSTVMSASAAPRLGAGQEALSGKGSQNDPPGATISQTRVRRPYVGMAHANAYFRRILRSGVDRDRSVCTVLCRKRICDGILLGRRCGVWLRDHQRPEPWLSRIQTTNQTRPTVSMDRSTSWISL